MTIQNTKLITINLYNQRIKSCLRLLTYVGFFDRMVSDTFRSFLYMEKSKNLEKKCHNRAEKFTFLRGLIVKARFLKYREI